MPDKDVQLIHKPCLRIVGQWDLKEAGVEDNQVEPFLTSSLDPPWSSHPGSPADYHAAIRSFRREEAGGGARPGSPTRTRLHHLERRLCD